MGFHCCYNAVHFHLVLDNYKALYVSVSLADNRVEMNMMTMVPIVPKNHLQMVVVGWWLVHYNLCPCSLSDICIQMVHHNNHGRNSNMEHIGHKVDLASLVCTSILQVLQDTCPMNNGFLKLSLKRKKLEKTRDHFPSLSSKFSPGF